MNKFKSLLPWSTNDSIAEKETCSEDASWQRLTIPDIPYEKIQKVAQTIRSQKLHTPSPEVITKILAKADQPVRNRWIFTSWLWGIPLMLLIFSLLWLVLQPGNQLQWVALGNRPATFHIYRAPSGTNGFKLIEELPVNPTQQSYQYADAFVLPGQNYQYRIEVRDQSGNTITSSTAIGNTWMTSVSQIAILLTGFMLTFGIITIVEEIKPSAWPFLLVP